MFYFIGENNNNFVRLYDCTCLGHTQIFECTICGPGFTVWQGSALQCQASDSEIRLRHSLFSTSEAHGQCNDGAIVARSVGSQAGCFTSALTVVIGLEMINQTIECVYYDNVQISSLTIGETRLIITEGINNIIYK